MSPTTGYPPTPYPYAPVRQSTNGLAVASLVLSLLWIVGLGSLLAVIFAVIARKQIRESNGAQGGGGLAIAGLVIGIVGLAGLALSTAVGLTVGRTSQNAAVSSCRSDAESVQTAVDAYQAQQSSYPSPPGRWSAANYTSNYSPLTGTTSNLGPYLRQAPNPGAYVIEYDSHGHVWVEAGGTYDTAYNATQDWANNPNACDVAS